MLFTADSWQWILPSTAKRKSPLPKVRHFTAQGKRFTAKGKNFTAKRMIPSSKVGSTTKSTIY
jgi:hypothetical protein